MKNSNFRYEWKREVDKSELHSTSRAILQKMSDYMKRDGSGCRLTITQISEKTGFSRSTVIRHLQKLKDVWIRVFQHKHWGQDWKNHSYQPLNPRKKAANEAVARRKSQQKAGSTVVPANPSIKVVARCDPSVKDLTAQHSTTQPKTRWQDHAKPLSQSKSPPLHSFIRPAGEVMAPDGSISRFPLTNPATGQKWTGVKQIAEAIFGSARRLEEYFFPPASPNNTGPRDLSLSGTENIDFGLEADYQAWSDSLTAESDSSLDAECQAWVAAYEGAQEWN